MERTPYAPLAWTLQTGDHTNRRSFHDSRETVTMTHETRGDEFILHLSWEEIEKIPPSLPIRWKIGVGYVMPGSSALLARVRRALARPLRPTVAA